MRPADAATAWRWRIALLQPLVTLGEVHRLAGRDDEALAATQEALAVAIERKERGFEAAARRLLGDIAVESQSEGSVAESHYRQALALATELSMRPLTAHCHAGLAKVYRRSAKPDQAREHFATAATLYREMSMTYWLEKAEVELRSLSAGERRP